MPERTVLIDGEEVSLDSRMTLMQACESRGQEIPRFCYHERLSVAGNCRMCLVEVKGMPKLQASCALTLADLRSGPEGQPPEILSDSEAVREGRAGVMEFLLLNHPLDCPICDQGGECDLQDQAMAYGDIRSRFADAKRAVPEKNFGPLIKTVMTRCIHCTRCVRFMEEIAGTGELGAIGRGEDMEIVTHLERAVASEIQGNVIDLCPVGALTSRPYAFKARPWELSQTETIDVMDALGANIRVDSRGDRLMRILPRENPDLNEEWITDKTRFARDGYLERRLDRPWMRGDDRKLREASWDEVLKRATERFQQTPPDAVGALAGDLAAVEDVYALRVMLDALGAPHRDCRRSGEAIGDIGGRAAYLFNPGANGIDRADAVLMLAASPRKDCALLNVRLLRARRDRGCPVAYIGEPLDLSYDAIRIGDGVHVLRDVERAVLNGGDPELSSQALEFLNALREAKRPLILVGGAALKSRETLASAARLASRAPNREAGWNGFAVMHRAAARVGALDVKCLPAEGGMASEQILAAAAEGRLRLLHLLGADEFDFQPLADAKKRGEGAFVIYQGSHGDRGAEIADLILPAASPLEASGIYVNLEGRPQRAERVLAPPGEAREDRAILQALATRLEAARPWRNVQDLRDDLFADYPHLADEGERTEHDVAELEPLAEAADREADDSPRLKAYPPRRDSFYADNAVARASAVLQEARRAAEATRDEQTNGAKT